MDGNDATGNGTERRDRWWAIGRVLTAHVVGLRDAEILDDPVAAALLTAMDGAERGGPPAAASSAALIAAFDERLDALSPPGVVGAGTVGRARAEVAATAARLELRRGLLALAEAVDGAGERLLELAGEHVFTLMPAHAGWRPAQPTTFAHFLGGVIAPLGRAGGALRSAYDEANRSPLGAGALASTGLPIDRARTAGLLGFAAPVERTFDAVAALDHLAAAAAAAARVAAALGRFAGELLLWLRTEPGSLRLGDAWTAEADPALAPVRPPLGLERLVLDARRLDGEAAAAIALTHAAQYGPAGATLDAALEPTLAVLAGAADLAGRFASLLAGGMEVNRAYLANRAGRDHTTSGELADLLVREEGLDPGSARGIAAMTIRRAIEQGLEASGITPELIDGSALLVIGRELGVEIERLGPSLAPRRFLERRGALGGPAPTATRAYLAGERDRLRSHERWRVAARAALAAAEGELERAAAEIVAGAA